MEVVQKHNKEENDRQICPMNPQKLFCLRVWGPPILSIQEYFGCIKKEKLY